jgi:hypothetical protein
MLKVYYFNPITNIVRAVNTLKIIICMPQSLFSIPINITIITLDDGSFKK